MMPLYDHAVKELTLAGYVGSKSSFDQMLAQNVLELIKVFAEQGHSGTSAPAVVATFRELALYSNLTPITGADDEWNFIADDGQHDGTGKLYQNNRCSHVFKDDNGAYDTEGRIFREPNGICYQNQDSRVPVEFPYTPTTEYVDVPASSHDV